MPTMSKRQSEPSLADLAPYAGRWVALVRGHVAGVGWTAGEARRAAKRNRPKEEPEVIFVPAVGVMGDADDADDANDANDDSPFA